MLLEVICALVGCVVERDLAEHSFVAFAVESRPGGGAAGTGGIGARKRAAAVVVVRVDVPLAFPDACPELRLWATSPSGPDRTFARVTIGPGCARTRTCALVLVEGSSPPPPRRAPQLPLQPALGACRPGDAPAARDHGVCGRVPRVSRYGVRPSPWPRVPLAVGGCSRFLVLLIWASGHGDRCGVARVRATCAA